MANNWHIPVGTGPLSFTDPVTGISYPHIADVEEFSLDLKPDTLLVTDSNGGAVGEYVTGWKVTGKAKAIYWDQDLVAAAIGAKAYASGVQDLTYTVATPTGSVAVTPTGTAFYKDRGVVDADGQGMVVTASAPTVGSYTVSGSTYGFNASQTGPATILYSVSTGSVNSFQFTPWIGALPVFDVTFSTTTRQPGAASTYDNASFRVTMPDIAFSFKKGQKAEYNVTFNVISYNGQPITFNHSK